jgi:hypothetical protein
VFDAGPLIREAQYQTFRKELQLGDTRRRIEDARLTLERMEQKFLADQEAWEKEKAKLREKAGSAAPK